MDLPLMPKATAVWLVDNTLLTFEQISGFCGLHSLEVQGIADGEVAQGIVGADPVATGQLTQQELDRCLADPKSELVLAEQDTPLARRTGPRYTPVSRRQDRPDAISWLLRNHPELTDGQVCKLVGTTKPTINAVRERTHWNSINIKPIDPVALGLCSQTDLDDAVLKAARRVERQAKAEEAKARSAKDSAPKPAAAAPQAEPTPEPEAPAPEAAPETVAEPEAVEAVAEPAPEPEAPAPEAAPEAAAEPEAVEAAEEPTPEPEAPESGEPAPEAEEPAPETALETVAEPEAAETVAEPEAAEAVAEPTPEPEAPAPEAAPETVAEPEAVEAAETVEEPTPEPEAPKSGAPAPEAPEAEEPAPADVSQDEAAGEKEG